MPHRWLSFKFRHSFMMSCHMIVILLLLPITPIIHGASIGDFSSSSLSSRQHASDNNDCDLRQCFTEQQIQLESMSCSKINQISACLRRLDCGGNLEIYTALTMINSHKKSCSSNVRSSVRAGDTSNTHQAIQYRQNSYRRMEQLTGLGLQYCLSAVLNYTMGSPVSSKSQFIAMQQSTSFPASRIANPEEFYRDSPPLPPLQPPQASKPRSERVRRSSNLIEASQAALQLIKSHQDRSTESETRPEDSMQADQAPISDLLYVPNPQPSPMITCIIFGDPHLRTFDSKYQTCNSLGTRPLIEHPLFYVQITNSRLNEQFNSTGVTKITVLVRGFGPCHINSNLIYESDSVAQVQPSGTFTDGSVNNFANMVHIKSSSQNQMVTIHLVHIGARVYISQFKGTHFLNVVVKFRSDMTNSPAAILSAISPISMCKSGCHPKEVVNLTKVLTDAGIDVDGQKDAVDDDVADEIVNIDEEPLEEETKVMQTRKKLESNDYDDYREYEDEISARKPPQKKRSKRDLESTNKPKNRKNRNKNRKNRNKNRKQNQSKPANAEDAFHMLRSSSMSEPQYFGPSDLTRSGDKSPMLLEETPIVDEELPSEPPKSPHEQCEDMREYYRLTCLYDVAVKGISNIDPHRFASSFDEKRIEGFSYIFDNHYYSTSPGSARIPVTSLTLLIAVLAIVCFGL